MYQDVLLRLSKDRTFRVSDPLPSPSSERRNPACGDEIALNVKVSDQKLDEIQYHAQACAITLASAAAMCALVQDQDLVHILERIQTLLGFLESEDEWQQEWGHESIPALGAVRARPMRLHCVRLPWLALQEALPKA